MLRRFVLALILSLLATGIARAEARTYCAPDAANLVVYVDKTTPYDETDKRALIDGIGRLFESLVGGERFSLRTIAESFSASTSLLDACLPWCPAAGLFDSLFGSCNEGLVASDRKALRTRLVGQLRDLLDNFVELPNSEIVRTIAITLPIELRPGRPNHVYMFTDLIENSTYLPGKDFFGKKTPVLLARVAADGLVPPLTGVDVHVFGVGRGGNPADRHPLDQALLEKLTGFWTGYFAAAGASLTIQPALGALP